MNESTYIVIGTPINREKAYIIDKFLKNQKEIQNNYPSSELVLATIEKDYIDELNGKLDYWEIKGRVLHYEMTKPIYALSWIWNVVCGREAIRQYILYKTEASHLLFIDSDMTCDPAVVNILIKKAGNYDVVASGYPGRQYGMITGGLGCSLISRHALQKIKFRCYEFSRGRVVDEGEVLEIDLFSNRLKYKRGYFVAIDHYHSDGTAKHIEPHPVSLFRKISNNLFIRFVFIKASILFRCNIPKYLQKLLFH